MCKENWLPNINEFSPEAQARITNEARRYQKELIDYLSSRGEKVKMEIPKDFGKGGLEKGKIYAVAPPTGTGKSSILSKLKNDE